MQTSPQKNYWISRFTNLIGCLLLAVSALAQTNEYYERLTEPIEGSWRLRTDAASRSTIVLFYNSNNQLVYQETLLGKHIRLTPKNTKRLNIVAAKLASKRLVEEAVKPDLLPGYNALADARETTKSNMVDSLFTSLETYLMPLRYNKIKLCFMNPNHNEVSITMTNNTKGIVYTESSTTGKYIRNLNLSPLEQGEYELTIADRRNKHVYRLALNYTGNPPMITSYHKNSTEAKPTITASKTFRVAPDTIQ